MAWVTGIKQVTTFQPERDGKQAIPKPQRIAVDLQSSCVGGTIRSGPLIFLPVHTGAGPCGTRARVTWGPGKPLPGTMTPLEWSVKNLVEPLQVWYAEQNRPRDPLSRAGCLIGAKSGGGNGRAELW